LENIPEFYRAFARRRILTHQFLLLSPIVSGSHVMRLSLILACLFPTILFGAGGSAPVPVRVTVSIPLVAAVEGPAQVVLAPGEIARIRVGVLANVPWVLGIHSPNASATIRESTALCGQPGGVTANRREVDICCSPQASGSQTIALIYTLLPR
jgi:hypothetical protein